MLKVDAGVMQAEVKAMSIRKKWTQGKAAGG